MWCASQIDLALQDSIFAADARVRAALQVGGEEDILYAILFNVLYNIDIKLLAFHFN